MSDVQRLRDLLGECYQIVGSMAYNLGIFNTEDVQKVLDRLAAAAGKGNIKGEPLLPWPKKSLPDLQTENEKDLEQQLIVLRAKFDQISAKLDHLAHKYYMFDGDFDVRVQPETKELDILRFLERYIDANGR